MPIIFGLNTKAVNSVELIQKLNDRLETKSIGLLAFVSHVQLELKYEAQEAGAGMVLPRSAFSANLPAILQRHAAIPQTENVGNSPPTRHVIRMRLEHFQSLYGPLLHRHSPISEPRASASGLR